MPKASSSGSVTGATFGRISDVRMSCACRRTVKGLPKSLLEASSIGRPMIASNVPGCREVVRDGITGIAGGTARQHRACRRDVAPRAAIRCCGVGSVRRRASEPKVCIRSTMSCATRSSYTTSCCEHEPGPRDGSRWLHRQRIVRTASFARMEGACGRARRGVLFRPQRDQLRRPRGGKPFSYGRVVRRRDPSRITWPAARIATTGALNSNGTSCIGATTSRRRDCCLPPRSAIRSNGSSI